jgi:hypothetical protein
MQGKKRIHYLIPFPLAHLIFRERLFLETQIWLLLKHWTNGHLELTPEVAQKLAFVLGTSRRTIGRAIERLRQRNWVGYNPDNGLTYVRGFDNLRRMERLPGRLGVWFNIQDIHKIEAFITACAYGYFVRQQKVRSWRGGAAAFKNGEAVQPARPAPLPKFFPVALSVLERKFGVSRSTIQRGRKVSEAAGFMAVRHSFTPIPDNNPAALLRGFPELKGRLFRKVGQWYIRETDEVQTFLNFKRRVRLFRH